MKKYFSLLMILPLVAMASGCCCLGGGGACGTGGGYYGTSYGSGGGCATGNCGVQPYQGAALPPQGAMYSAYGAPATAAYPATPTYATASAAPLEQLPTY